MSACSSSRATVNAAGTLISLDHCPALPVMHLLVGHDKWRTKSAVHYPTAANSKRLLVVFIKRQQAIVVLYCVVWRSCKGSRFGMKRGSSRIRDENVKTLRHSVPYWFDWNCKHCVEFGNVHPKIDSRELHVWSERGPLQGCAFND